MGVGVGFLGAGVKDGRREGAGEAVVVLSWRRWVRLVSILGLVYMRWDACGVAQLVVFGRVGGVWRVGRLPKVRRTE